MSKIYKTIAWVFIFSLFLTPSLSIAEPYIAPFEPVIHPKTPQEAIKKYAKEYGVSEEKMMRVAKCESAYNPKAFNPKDSDNLPALGLYQYKIGTWNYFSKKAGLKNPDIWNFDHQAKVTAYAFSIGESRQWGCK